MHMLLHMFHVRAGRQPDWSTGKQPDWSTGPIGPGPVAGPAQPFPGPPGLGDPAAGVTQPFVEPDQLTFQAPAAQGNISLQALWENCCAAHNAHGPMQACWG